MIKGLATPCRLGLGGDFYVVAATWEVFGDAELGPLDHRRCSGAAMGFLGHRMSFVHTRRMAETAAHLVDHVFRPDRRGSGRSPRPSGCATPFSTGVAGQWPVYFAKEPLAVRSINLRIGIFRYNFPRSVNDGNQSVPAAQTESRSKAQLTVASRLFAAC